MGVIFAIKYSPWHLLHTKNRFALNCHVWVMSKAQTVVNVAQAMPGLMALGVSKSSQLPKMEVITVLCSHHLNIYSSQQLLNRMFHK
jgi:hypothetical protein